MRVLYPRFWAKSFLDDFSFTLRQDQVSKTRGEKKEGASLEEHMREAQKGLPASFPALAQDSTKRTEMLAQDMSSLVTLGDCCEIWYFVPE